MSSRVAGTVVVALVQDEPVLLDLTASLDRAITRMQEAAAVGARLVAFAESWLPGYPVWVDVSPGAAMWDDAAMLEVHARLRAQAVVVPSPSTERLCAAARRLGVVVVMGLHERVDAGPGHGTLYNTVLVIAADGTIVGHHRKLVPTHGERLVWGPGDADGLRAVDTSAGRVGALVCWEHWMPLARQALHDDGEQLHVALWPTVRPLHALASRHYAFEGRCFVLAVGSLLRCEALPPQLRPAGTPPDALLLRGGSCIAGPDSEWIVEPIFDEARVIVAELDLAAIERASLTLDVSGHYARPDVLRLVVDRGRRRGPP